MDQFKEKNQSRICPVQHQSLEQAFRRELKKNNIVIQNGAFHTCRKAYATQKYKEDRENGLSVKEAMSKVSVNLGHGATRFELMKEYICTALV